ncbi:MAG: SufD family Fe-S cluster assembly protein [Muribaculaceae bacterium]|nr:SufD family Fe-S cluster assembly protein [Muribaculaceae bacterium]
MENNALKQYTDLYTAHRELIDSHSAAPLNVLRPEALDSLLSHPLPKKGSENYEHTDLESVLAPDYGLNLARIPLDVDPSRSFQCGVPTLSSAIFMLINDSWGETEKSRKLLPEGVEVCSLCRKAKEDPEEVARYYGKLADISNPIVALSTLLAQDGLWLKIGKGVKLDRPLQLVNILQNLSPLMAIRRLVIVVEEDAEARLLICDHTQNHEIDMLGVQTVEIFAGRNSHFDYYDLEESGEKTHRLNSLYLRQEEGSNVMIDGITLFNGITRNEYFCRFVGEHSELHLYGMGIEDSERKLDTYSVITHEVGNCHSDELFKYVVDDDAEGAFAGLIYVSPGAQKTEAYQSNRNLIGHPKARMFSKPQLEIYNDDVKCSHGTAIGQLDELQMFYMRTRGIDESTARLLLKQAFMADVINGVRLSILRDRLQMLVERRFAGELHSCADCGGC